MTSRPAGGHTVSWIVAVLLVTVACIGAVYWLPTYLEAQKRTARADATSWNLVAGALLDNEVLPGGGPAVLRSPTQILGLHRNLLTQQSGPIWDDTSSAQRARLQAIIGKYIAAFEQLQQSLKAEAELYLRSGISLSANLSAPEMEEQLKSMAELPSTFARIKTAWDAMPPDVGQARVTQLRSLTDNRIKLIDGEIMLLRHLNDNPKDWRPVRRNDNVRLPVFGRPDLQARLKSLMDEEVRDSGALLKTLTQLMAGPLARQLKAIR